MIYHINKEKTTHDHLNKAEKAFEKTQLKKENSISYYDKNSYQSRFKREHISDNKSYLLQAHSQKSKNTQ